MLNFTPNEIRVLGCLIEKQLATPDYYPMTENSLVLASNQKSSRDPVLSLEPDVVGAALGELSRKEFIEQIKVSGSRAFKFRQRLDLRWGISDLNAETDRDVLAVLAVLSLRGPQTVGQIRQRTERMFFFPDLDHVQKVIVALKEETEDRPALVKEDRSIPGREVRYIHLLGPHPTNAGTMVLSPEEIQTAEANPLIERIEKLEARLALVEAQLGISSEEEDGEEEEA